MGKVASTKPVPISRSNSRVNGAARRVAQELWDRYDWNTARIEPPSVFFDGVYLKVALPELDAHGVEIDRYHDRIYPRHGSRSPRPVPEMIGGVWCWTVPDESDETDWPGGQSW